MVKSTYSGFKVSSSLIKYVLFLYIFLVCNSYIFKYADVSEKNKEKLEWCILLC